MYSHKYNKTNRNRLTTAKKQLNNTRLRAMMGYPKHSQVHKTALRKLPRFFVDSVTSMVASIIRPWEARGYPTRPILPREDTKPHCLPHLPSFHCNSKTLINASKCPITTHAHRHTHSLTHSHTHKHTYIHIYIYIGTYIYI